jgi:hypothetical protein
VIALQKCQKDLEKIHSKVYAACRRVAIRFERVHIRTIQDYTFEQGDLVLMQNTKIEKSLNKKMKPQYLGPLIVLSKNKGGAYILCELDGSVLHNPVGAFRLIPYFARKSIYFPEGVEDVHMKRLRELEEQEYFEGEDELGDIQLEDEEEYFEEEE